MVMSYIFAGCVFLSLLGALITGSGQALGGAVLTGAQSGITLSVSIAGSLCLWSGVGALMEQIGANAFLSKLLSPLLSRIFPTFKKDRTFAGYLSSNVCANLLGLGNAATPMGIEAARRLAPKNGIATHELCRLIVLNTASIQLIPSNVAAIRAGLGCASPFDILPAVWITSLCSAGLGLAAAWLLGKAGKYA